MFSQENPVALTVLVLCGVMVRSLVFVEMMLWATPGLYAI